MKLKFFLFLAVFFCNVAVSQEVSDGIDMVSPIVWGTMVYVKAKESTKKRLLKEFELSKKDQESLCNSKYDDFENWYCDKKPELAFRALDGYGNQRYEAMLCKDNDTFRKFKYFNSKVFIQYHCLVASWLGEADDYEFHSINDWFGSKYE